jgi:hypothetical protein
MWGGHQRRLAGASGKTTLATLRKQSAYGRAGCFRPSADRFFFRAYGFEPHATPALSGADAGSLPSPALLPLVPKVSGALWERRSQPKLRFSATKSTSTTAAQIDALLRRFRGSTEARRGSKRAFYQADKSFGGLAERFAGSVERSSGSAERFGGPERAFHRSEKLLGGPEKRFRQPEKPFGGAEKRFRRPEKSFRRAAKRFRRGSESDPSA